MRSRMKSTAAVGAMGVAAVIFAASPASATTMNWQRSCGTTYYATVDGVHAKTLKGGDGSCAGYSYVRVKLNGTWSSWRLDPYIARINHSNIQASQHKGCSDCSVKTLYP